MHFRNNHAAAVAIAAAVLLLSGKVSVSAQDTSGITRLTPAAMEPVKSGVSLPEGALDTLDTADPRIKVLLLSDYTWKFIKDPTYARDEGIFTEDWNTELAVPYRMPADSLPSQVALWIVDTLSGYHCPHQSEVYSKFGYRHRRRHQGCDLPLPTGTPVYSAFDGKVRLAKYYSGYGNLVIIRHENGLETFYAHLSKIYVKPGDWISAGTVVGLGGSTGRSTGPHLHFETRYKGYAFDPEWLIDFKTGTLRHRLFVLKKKYFNAGARYVPESDQEEIDILEGDAKDKEEAAKLEQAKKAKANSSAKYYTIRKGDTLGKIAARNRTTVKKLCRLNGISERTVLRPGRKIRVR